jgi:glycyl-tRNA synthetase
MSQPLDFQSLMLALEHFWADQGCLIWQPYYSQVGAGTMNPATALRVLGPEPWNVAYIEPSIRPDDGRYGENPNRLQQHYQFQVILKPDPGNPQELYLRSLQAIGIDPHEHDIRFVEDNWESPALGAWGLGWEVWCDGQEITQFTYFQQAGGRPTDPVSVEITYGLDRIAIALQRARGFRNIRWNDQLTAGDVNLAGEQEHSKYYFEVADIERNQRLYELYEAEAEACLANNLILPAHDYMLKCSHTFNVLDTRGAVGVTERQAFFGRMRELARRIADAYIDQRQRLEFPWMNNPGIRDRVIVDSFLQPLPSVDAPAPFLFEIGTEELPAGDLDSLRTQLAERMAGLLSEARLEHGAIKVYGTPRRLVVFIENVSARQPDRQQVVKGPPADRAFDALGQPTKAAEGFARSRGMSVSDLKVAEIDGGRYVVVSLDQPGRSAPQVLAEMLPGLIGSLKVDKGMRWNASNIVFSRPIRWLLALFADQVIPFSFAGLVSGRKTRGLRFSTQEEFAVHDPSQYFDYLANQGIILDTNERQENIQNQVRRLAAEVNGQVMHDPALLSEVANLVEAPLAILGTFDEAHLQLPLEVLISVMKKHQRYFPVFKGDVLLPCFITVSNHNRAESAGVELVIEGNEHVLRARFADADFFVREDLQRRLEDFLPRLGTLTFQARLGSMLDKSRRIQAQIPGLAALLKLTSAQVVIASRAAELCKADLATQMVVEMTSLQGLMGRHYARISGETLDVANAIFEHYLPRYTGDMLPASLPGIAVGIADRLDTLSGLFEAGLAPSGTKDPFAQRRAALGLVQLLMYHEIDLDLRKVLFEITAPQLPLAATPQSQEAVLQFITDRQRSLLLEQGFRYDVIDSVLAVQSDNPASAFRSIKELSRWVTFKDWPSILPAYARCVRITRDLKERFPLDPGMFVEQAEHDLYAALLRARGRERRQASVDGLLGIFTPMIPVINHFFDTVLVMAEDSKLRTNRLGLLQEIAELAAGVADFSKLEGF